MGVNRRNILGLVAVTGAGYRAVIAQVPPAAARGAAPVRSPDDELQIARAQRLRDAQRIAMVNLPQTVEPAFQFRA